MDQNKNVLFTSKQMNAVHVFAIYILEDILLIKYDMPALKSTPTHVIQV